MPAGEKRVLLLNLEDYLRVSPACQPIILLFAEIFRIFEDLFAGRGITH